jgi:hypothetical protein
MREALEGAGEVLVFIRHNFGMREWWLASNAEELDQALSLVTSSNDRSDAVEVYATGEFPYRGDDTEWLRAKAIEILAKTDVVLACKRPGDPELHDVEETDEMDDVDEWLDAELVGERLVGSHPLLMHDDFYPDVADAFLAYGERPDGTVVPGSY